MLFSVDRKSLFMLFIFSLPVMSSAAPQGWSPLLEPSQLSIILDNNPDIRVIHVTGNFVAGHIPGAITAPYPQFRGPQSNPGAVLDLEVLTTLVQRLGIDAQTPVAIIHQGSNPSDFGAAARVYWTLKSLGVKDLALLNGGFSAWREAGLPVSTDVATVEASTFTPQWHDDWRVTTAEVEALVQDGSARLIDARQPTFFEGLQASTGRPGTIKGAGNLNFETWFDGSRVKPQSQVGSILASYAQGAAPITVSFCNTGHQAAINWFVISELQQIPNTRLYAESMTEWTIEDRPMDNQPNRIKYYWEMTAEWFGGLVGS